MTEPTGLPAWLTDRLDQIEEPRRSHVLREFLAVNALGITLTPVILDEVITRLELDAESEAERDRLEAEKATEANAKRLAAALDRERIQQAVLRDPRSLVYYVRFGDRVKIGTTTALRHRLRNIPHDEILALEPGSYDIEHQRHEQFADLWVKGEWFRYEEPLISHIAALREEAA